MKTYYYKAADREPTSLNPEARLAAAMIVQALHDLLSNSHDKNIRDTKSAWAWLHHDTRLGLSFLNCCEASNMNPSVLRRWVARNFKQGKHTNIKTQ